MSTADSIRGSLFKNSGILGVGALVVGGAAMFFGAPVVAGIAGIAGLGAAAGIVGSSVLPDKALTSIAGVAQSIAGAAKNLWSGFDKLANAQQPAATPVVANDPPRAQPANYVNLADDPKFNGGAVPMPTVTGDSLTPGPSITVSPSQGQNISMGPATRPMPVFGR